MHPRAHGRFPRLVYRGLGSRELAEEFVWLPGSDTVTVLQEPGDVWAHVELGNPKFVLCCSRPDVELAGIRAKYAAVVKIDNPRALAREISDYLADQQYHLAGGVEGCYVHYNADGLVRADL